MEQQKSITRNSPARMPALPLIVVILSFTHFTRGQDSVSMSIAGAQAAEARRKAHSTIGYYNLTLGPTGWKLTSSLGIQYDDNVTLTSKAESDVLFTPEVDMHMLWPVSEENSLDLA